MKKDGGEFCDITLMLGEIFISVYKVILVVRCNYFEVMFRWNDFENYIVKVSNENG